ncbi:MAG: hypothetical protein HY926_00850 [Elusimicrobia bacterium]|nr:hypothetical protein [Elusimicrobiota bacterium]
MNITLPKDLAARLKDIPNKSAFIAQALREKLAAAEARRREALLAEAYRESARENVQLVQDWDAVSGDGIE